MLWLEVFYSVPVPETSSKWEQYQHHSFILDKFPSHIDLVVVDGVSLPLPLFAWCNIPSIFYCHFPDKLLAMHNSSHDNGMNANLNEDVDSSASKSPIDVDVKKSNTLSGMLRAKYRGVLDRLENFHWVRRMCDGKQSVHSKRIQECFCCAR